MSATTFDTHAAVEALTRAGVAAKADGAALETRVTARMAALTLRAVRRRRPEPRVRPRQGSDPVRTHVREGA